MEVDFISGGEVPRDLRVAAVFSIRIKSILKAFSSFLARNRAYICSKSTALGRLVVLKGILGMGDVMERLDF